MALPIIAASMGGIILTSLTAFFATKIPVVLAALGLSYGVMKGMEGVTGTIVQGLQNAIGEGGVVTWGGQTVDLIGLAGAAGVFDAANIVVSGFAALVAMQSGRVVLKAISK